MRLRHAMGWLTAGLIILASAVTAEVPLVIMYQGCLNDSLGSPVPNGEYGLTLTLYTSADGDDAVWWCREQMVQVTSGLFDYALGEACALPHNLFAEYPNVWLGIAVNSGKELTPRTHITSVAYAFHSLRADTADFVSSGVAGGWIDAGTVVHLENSGDSVGVGITTPSAKLDVDGAINTANWYYMGGERFISDSGNGNTLIGVQAGINNTGISNTFMGYYAGIDNAGSNNTFIGRACGQQNSSGAGNTFIGVSCGSANISGEDNTYMGYNAGISATGSDNVCIGRSAGTNASGSGNVFIGRSAGYFEGGSNKLFIDNSSTSTPLIYGDFETDRVGIGTSNPLATFHAISESGTAIRGEASGLMVNAIKGITSSAGGSGVGGSAAGTAGSGVSGYATGMYGKGVYGHASADSSYGVYGLAIGSASHGVYGESSVIDGHGVHAVHTVDYGRAIYAENTAEGGVGIEAIGGPDGYAARFSGNVILVSRVGRQTILELGEGLDYAEGFDAAIGQRPEPGTVVCIDPNNPGKLAISSKPYDSKVAGIVAGANGIGSGVKLGGDKFDMNVALAGRVYCNVDATMARIEPGDLLTTSPIPGHAMKVTDYDLARGSILGKAMQSMEAGQKGRILVLVTLQ